ncbi:MAG TPA: acyl carrier protein [Stellaceae bacterium]|jgi:acyl carrier protein|nr:acyl carrier protein [Stellaceae bacterium]
MTDRVNQLFSEVLGVSVETISDATSPDNTPQWDSMAAMNLVVAIEDEFDITLSTAEIISMRDVAIVKKVLTAKGVAGA